MCSNVVPGGNFVKRWDLVVTTPAGARRGEERPCAARRERVRDEAVIDDLRVRTRPFGVNRHPLASQSYCISAYDHTASTGCSDGGFR